MLPCFASQPVEGGHEKRMLPLPGLDDEEGAYVPEGLPPIVDAHVHVFADRLFAAIRRWFEQHGWPIRYELDSRAVIQFLRSRGVERLVLLHYAHKPGIAEDMNRYVADLCREDPNLCGLATVHPDDMRPASIIRSAFEDGLRGVKLHCHVQCMPIDDRRLFPVYETCAEAGYPVVIHAGREPKSDAYRCDPHEICEASRVARILTAFPDLQVLVPHLGADEFDAYARLLVEHDNLWVDTTMAIAQYLPTDDPAWMITTRPDRILYGTDFPNLPYAWDRELKRLVTLDLSDEDLEAVVGGNANGLFFKDVPAT